MRPCCEGLEIERLQFSPTGQEGCIVQIRDEDTSDRKRDPVLELVVKTDLRSVWYSERLGIEDSRDNDTWDVADHLFIARDAKNSWFSVWGVVGATDAQPDSHPQPINRRAWE